MARLGSFVGRADELVELRRLLRTTRLLTLTGPGGVGKTRLALELASLGQRGGRCEVGLVELGSATTGEQARQRITAALAGVRGVDSGAAGAVAAGTPGAAGADRDRLLVLDNCEHVLDACGRVLGALLPCHPGLRILATSREPLRLPGETVYSVGGLALPDLHDGGSPVALLRSDAVRLFVDRGRAVARDFQLTEENAAHIAGLCAKLDGLPLALELAAGLVRAFPPAEIHHRLDDRLSLLTCGWRTADPRHQSLRSAIEWSYELLTPHERSLVRSLSLLPGGFGTDAAVVAAGEDIPESAVPQLLACLEAKSLIISCAGPVGSARFRMPESIRCYGYERLRAAGEEVPAYDRLVDWLAELALPFREAASRPYGCPAGQAAYYGRGPMQLSWNFNYKAAGDALGIDLLHQPNLVETDATISWKTALWYWTTQAGPGSMTPHQAIITGAGFGATIRSINGALEYDGKNPAEMQDRVNLYKQFTQTLGVTPGSKLTC